MDYTRELLNNIYKIRKDKNIHYSQRAFARDLGVSRTTLSEVFLGKRKLSKDSCLKIKSSLSLEDSEFERLLSDNHISFNDKAFRELSPCEFEKINNLCSMAVLSLLKSSKFMWNDELLIKKLRYSEEEIRESLGGLLELEFISFNEGHYQRVVQNFRTTSEVSSKAIQKFHKENLEKASSSIDEVDVLLRDITSMTMNIKKENIAMAKEEIKNFRRRLTNLLEKESGDDIYSLAISLHPITEV